MVRKKVPSTATIAVVQYLEVDMIFAFQILQIPPTAPLTLALHTSAQQVRMVTFFLTGSQYFVVNEMEVFVFKN